MIDPLARDLHSKIDLSQSVFLKWTWLAIMALEQELHQPAQPPTMFRIVRGQICTRFIGIMGILVSDLWLAFIHLYFANSEWSNPSKDGLDHSESTKYDGGKVLYYHTCGQIVVKLLVQFFVSINYSSLQAETKDYIPLIIFGSLSVTAGFVTQFALPETNNLDLPETLDDDEGVIRRYVLTHCGQSPVSRKIPAFPV